MRILLQLTGQHPTSPKAATALDGRFRDVRGRPGNPISPALPPLASLDEGEASALLRRGPRPIRERTPRFKRQPNAARKPLPRTGMGSTPAPRAKVPSGS
jgi:hypothetical protein